MQLFEQVEAQIVEDVLSGPEHDIDTRVGQDLGEHYQAEEQPHHAAQVDNVSLDDALVNGLADDVGPDGDAEGRKDDGYPCQDHVPLVGQNVSQDAPGDARVEGASYVVFFQEFWLCSLFRLF